MPITQFTHQERTIFYVDYTDCKTESDMIHTLHSIAQLVDTMSSDDEILALINFEGTYASPGFMKEARRLYTQVFDHKIMKGAVLGVSGVKKIILTSYNFFARQKIVPFNTREKAVEYLVSR